MVRLIDTSALFALERAGRPRVSDGAQGGDVSAVSTITAAELLFGVERADSPSRRRQWAVFVEAVLSELTVIPFDLESARVPATLLAQLRSIGQSIGQNDLMIAATAMAHGYDVVTHNRRDFEQVSGLSVWLEPLP